ncbi:AAA family ATPase [Vicingus serpentipes]|uniref:AAA family ATPase n=1 Tax=Vicingus serpentipes TaxID=1926625 RepID=A0A5C6RW27_9FLAO|nr:AAA family ATPase [Vicingus serpentipes]TXB66155.1 AAA family ATPase [Vicingus serpentipes]
MFRFFNVENFRVFKGDKEFEFSGVNVITGKNSSGKSSVLKSLLLLKDNFINNKFPTILNFDGGDHGLGSIKKTLCQFDGKHATKASFSWPAFTVDASYTPKIKMSYTVDKKDPDRGFVYAVEFYSVVRKELIGIVEYQKGQKIHIMMKFDLLYEMLEGMMLPDHQKIIERSKRKSKGLDNSYDVLKKMGTYDDVYPIEYIDITYHEIYGEGDEDDGKLNLLHNADLWSVLEQYFKKKIGDDKVAIGLKNSLEFRFSTSFSDFLYHGYVHLPTIRGNQDRLHFDKYDKTPLGLLLKEFIKVDQEAKALGQSNPKKVDDFKKIKDYLNKWLIVFELGDDIKIKREYGSTTSVQLLNNNHWGDLSDLGFGSTQLITILLQIYVFSCKKIIPENPLSPYFVISIEEPEANLHPDFQSKLADMFYEGYELFGIHFILETHSEYMIRKFQFIIANRGLEGNPGKKPISDKFRIYYINKLQKEKKDLTQIINLNPNENGVFQDNFGEGFYDEATNTKFKILKATNK